MGKYQKALLWTVLIVGAIAGLLRALLFKAWKLPDDPVLAASVGPTLGDRDTVIILFRGTPTFGDLVRCVDPENPGRYSVGRIAGVEGDKIDVDGYRLIVNGKKYDNYSACKKPTFTVAHPTSGAEVELQCDVVEMGGGWHYRGYSNKPFVSEKRSYTIGEGMVFLLSDNRELHDDSRDFGQLPLTACKERIVFRTWGKEGWSDSDHRFTFIH